MPARRSAIADSWSTSDSAKSRWVSVWTLSTPTTWSCQVSGTDSIEATNRRWSMPADPQEPGVGGDVGDDHGLPGGGDPAGDPLPERDDRAADLEAVEAVRRGERQARPVPVEQVERRRRSPRGRRASRRRRSRAAPPRSGRSSRDRSDLVQEAQLGDRVVGRSGTGSARAGARRRTCGPRGRPSRSPYKPRRRPYRSRLRPGTGHGALAVEP